MAQELKITPGMGYTQERVTRLIGWLTIGAAGAISAQSVTAVGCPCGVTWTRNAAGDYRGTLHRGYKRAIRASADVTMPAAATAPTVAAGNDAFMQGLLATNFSGAAPVSTVALTTVRSDTDALADPTSGVTLTYELELSDA